MHFFSVNHSVLGFAAVLVMCAAAAICDVRAQRIPNVLVGILFIAGLALNALAGLQYAGMDVVITIAVLILGTAAYALKLIGGGDIKLLAAAAGTLGYPTAVGLILFTFLAGGVIALAVSAARGTMRTTVANIRGVALPMMSGVAPPRLQSGTPMPYALAICAGTLITLVSNGSLPHLRF